MVTRRLRTTAAAVALVATAAGCSGPEIGYEEIQPASDNTAEATETPAFDVSGPDGATQVNREILDSTFVATVIGSQITAYSEASTESEPVASFDSPNTYGDVAGNAVTFQSINHNSRPAGWVQVLLPIRPNGSVGWVQESEVTLVENSYRIEVDRASHELRLYERGELTKTSPVAIGTGDTPTPTGSFYIHELLQPPIPDGPYGTFAYGLSGFSETLEEFNGGNGVVGIHGTNDPSTIGSDVSHGCIRLENEVIEELVNSIPLGTPVYIT